MESAIIFLPLVAFVVDDVADEKPTQSTKSKSKEPNSKKPKSKESKDEKSEASPFGRKSSKNGKVSDSNVI